MKLTKPSYNPSNNIYVSQIKDGFRFECEIEGKVYTPSFDDITNKFQSQETCDELLSLTKNWFTKPLTSEWLLPRLRCEIPTQGVEEDFEGKCVWEAKSLHISKENFVIHFEMIEKVNTEKVMISFHEDEPVKEEIKEEKTRRGDTLFLSLDKTQQKKIVLASRERASKALFKAERLTQLYVQLYGDETDWEDESDGDISS
jgi:hypothetical protein